MRFVAAALVMAASLGLVLAGDVTKATVVSYDKQTMKLVVKAGAKERTLELKKNSHIHDVDGKHLKVADWPAKLKKDTKLEIEEEGGKLIEINIKK
jgi:hypothetical protein